MVDRPVLGSRGATSEAASAPYAAGLRRVRLPRSRGGDLPHLDRERVADAILTTLASSRGDRAARRGGRIDDDDELLRRAWNLDALAAATSRSCHFSASRSPRRRVLVRPAVDLVHAWRRFPFIDPEHPDPTAAARGPAAEPRSCSTTVERPGHREPHTWYPATESRTGESDTES